MTPREPLQQVPTRAGVRLRGLPLPVLLGLLLVGGLCALLALNTASAAQELKQRALTDRNAAISDAEQQLMRDLAAKQAPASLAAAAMAQGLVPNPNPAFLRINADGSVTVLGSPTPASVPPPPVTSKPSPAATPSATTKSAPSTSARSSAKPSSSAKPMPAVSSSAGSRTSSPRVTAPVVTVTVTKPAPAASSTPSTRPSSTKSKAPGGH